MENIAILLPFVFALIATNIQEYISKKKGK